MAIPVLYQPPTARPRQHRSIFVNDDFRRYFTGDSVSKVGTQISYLALPLLAIHALHAGPAAVGALGALGSLAFLVIGLPVGAKVERLRRRPVMIAADLVRAVLLVSLPITYAFDALSMWQLYLVVLLVGAGTVFFDVASGAYVPHLVGRRNLLVANTQLSSMQAGADIAGRSGAGFLVQAFTAPFALVLDALSYLWSAVCLISVRKREPRPEPVHDRHLGRDMVAGLRLVLGTGSLRTIAIETSWSNLCLRMIITLIPVIVVSDLHRSDAWVGVFLAVGGVGVLLGSTWARRIGARLGYGRALWVVGAGCAPFALLVPLINAGPAMWISMAGWLMATFKVGVDNVLKVSLRQRITPDAMLSRMGATYRFMITGALAIGSAAAGVVADATTVRTAVWVAAAGLAVSWVMLLLSPLRHLRELPEAAA